LERMAEKSVNNLLQGIEDSKKIPFERVLFALGIRYVGETVAKKIAKALKNIEAIAQADFETLVNIDEVGDKIAESVVQYFHNQQNVELVTKLKNHGLQMAVVEQFNENASVKLAGLSIVISGVFTKHSRDEYKKLIELHGGKNVGSISAKTSFILAGENMGPSKLEKAQSLGVSILNEDEFLALIE